MADYLSRWAYPASKGMTDVSAHGDEAETPEAKTITDMERMMEEDGVKCFVILAADALLGGRVSRAVRVFAPDAAESDKQLFPEGGGDAECGPWRYSDPVGGGPWAWGAGFEGWHHEVRRAGAAARSAMKVVPAASVTVGGRRAGHCCCRVWDGWGWRL